MQENPYQAPASVAETDWRVGHDDGRRSLLAWSRLLGGASLLIGLALVAFGLTIVATALGGTTSELLLVLMGILVVGWGGAIVMAGIRLIRFTRKNSDRAN